MSTPQPAPRSALGGVIAVWIVAAVVGVVAGVLAPLGTRATWLAIVLGGCVILSFAIQLAAGRPDGFIRRVGMSVLGALLVLGVIGVGFGLAAIVAV
ncbi:hypothetical protein [Microbacterium candidum]|uniref:Uncharacterized protein n=1 Tax=Microbacterium candidum TaxID=3041922 RepID=A0ABT7N2X9_9MICO|nr:hypothetical protein [Microbacterium sp. ASV49]MDL9981065.1 hypothetical protein [Microbacterium sp. ASV49]